jgi:hypothetical protein
MVGQRHDLRSFLEYADGFIVEILHLALRNLDLARTGLLVAIQPPLPTAQPTAGGVAAGRTQSKLEGLDRKVR